MTSKEALETLKHCTDLNVANYSFGYKEEIEIIEKDLKALEIIKKKLVDMRWLVSSFQLNCSNEEQCDRYNKQWEYIPHKKAYYLNQEEYDLLKKILNTQDYYVFQEEMDSLKDILNRDEIKF